MDDADPAVTIASSKQPPLLLLMGMRRCGKSSIQNVVFNKMSPNETLFLESTTRVAKNLVMSFLQFQIWDFPGHVDINDPSFDAEANFARCDTILYIIDCQDEIIEPMRKLFITVTKAHAVNPQISFEVFLHKVDGLSDDHKIETQREIHQRITDDLADAGLDNIHISFYLTSIYDHSIFEAFSKVLQKLISQLPTLENLLNILCSNSGIEKAFLFDTFSKVYVATDSSPVDNQSFELCSDMIDVVVDFSSIYCRLGEHRTAIQQPPPSSSVTAPQSPATPSQPAQSVSPSPASNDAYSMLNIGNGMILYLRPVDQNLSLVCLIREDNFEKKGLIDFNFGVFRNAIMDVLEVRRNLSLH